ncbi:hypothetical protein EDF62_3088 [Leucobacter luti]|uniref:Uncharacterized protein n=1 Tax=Leucobacter luti TaxID=340320 RepID=A0A4R6RSG1_9MICO|nr:hypothetical protein EDF62_3088 [Leucobacter luti]
MSLDNKSLLRLLDGTQRATEKQKLRWERVGSATGVGIAGLQRSVLSAFSSQTVLRAKTNEHLYELVADSYERAPFELTIWQRKSGQAQVVANYRSSTKVTEPEAIQVNRKLEKLFKTASNSIEAPSVVVDRLLQELGE